MLITALRRALYRENITFIRHMDVSDVTLQVDLTPPKAQLTLAPAPLTGTSSARFQFFATIAGSAVRCATCAFLCRLDQATWQPCLQGSGDASGAVYR